MLKEKGQLTTSTITKELCLSEPTARRIMREFQALRIATVSSTSGYANSELTLVLNHKFKWFLSEEFQFLRNNEDPVTTTYINQSNIGYRRMYLPIITKTLSNSYILQKACDSCCHTLKANSPLETDKKINEDNKRKNEYSDNDQSIENEINFNHKTDDDCKKIKNYIIQQEKNSIINNPNSSEDKGSINENIIQKNSVSLGPENFQPVTASLEKCHTESEYDQGDERIKDVIEDILKIIRDENGLISLGYALHLAYQRSEVVREYFKGEKLIARENRKVRNLFVEINRHLNIEVVQRKPVLVVKWIANEEKEVILNN